MNKYRLSKFTRGWFIGNFLPSVLQLKECEVGYLHHQQGEAWPMHYQKVATEINYLVKGSITFQFLDGHEDTVNAGDVFVFPPGKAYAAKPIFHTDCEVVCIKSPSIPDDKVVIE